VPTVLAPSLAAPALSSWRSEPAPALRSGVLGYLQLVIDVPDGHETVLTQSASTEPMACVTWSGGIRIGGREAAHPVCLVGPMEAPLSTRFSGSAWGFFVRFTPAGIRRVLGIRGADYRRMPPFDRAAPVAPGVRAWAARIADAPDFEARVALTDAWLAQEAVCRAEEAPAAGDALVDAAVARIESGDGVVRMDALAAALGVSASTLRRRFVAGVGLSPKTYSEIVRLRRAHAFLRATPGATWADAVVAFGYTDQAHLGHAYTRYAGVSPTRWARDAREMDLAFGMGADESAPRARFLQEMARPGAPSWPPLGAGDRSRQRPYSL